MDRNIPTGEAVAGLPPSYLDKLYKLIPAEVTAAYTAIASLTSDPDTPNASIIMLTAFAVLLVCVPFYLSRLQGVSNQRQIAVSTVSFPVWAANISSTALIENYPTYLSGVVLGVALILWTVITPLLLGRR